jgi:hypothetical protein
MKSKTKLIIWDRLRIIDKIDYDWRRFNKIKKTKYIKIKIIIYKIIK